MRNSGVWGQTVLMDAVLSGSKNHISTLLQNPLNLNEKNVLGQTAVHLTVLRPGTLSMILQMHADFDVTDIYGNSPLVYAAAYGCTESVILLLNAGASPLKDGHLKLLQHAVTWHHWNLVTRVLRVTKHLERRQWWWNWPWLMSPEFLRKIFDLGVDKNLIFSDGSSLLHHAMRREWIDALFDAGFDNIEQSDDEGNTALLKFADSFTIQYDLVEQLLSPHCNLNHRNNRGGTALGMACRQDFLHFVPSSHIANKELPRYLSMIVKLVVQNADNRNSDNCPCWCAPNGCPPLLQLLRHNESSVGYLWVLECIMILEEIQGSSIAQKVLLDLKRVSEFEAVGMTHVCCRGRQTETDELSDQANKILEIEKKLAESFDEKMREITINQGNTSIQESWLGILANFRMPDKSLKREKYWRTWNPAIGHSNEMISLGTRSLTRRSTSGLGVYKIVEEKDQYWELTEATAGHEIPQSALYSAWVENWYEKRKYWAARQAEALEMSS
ncbi:hypothetical protein N7493_002924 [Penicillium malachiteum]|uniref:Ankyrin n=1 Tax=Penicillium malachiteum TaxID=1324776 RepID=A0AAD6HSS2_9EURO|nr:hypothetical protein N7493_002924 [Penicillium malachiteum]